MKNKVYSHTGRRIKRTYTTDERIIYLYRELGLSVKEAARQFRWLETRIQGRALSLRLNSHNF